MTEVELISHVVIFNGIKEFRSEDIFRDKDLFRFVITNTLYFPNSLLQEIKSERGIIKILTDEKLEKYTIDLEGVSAELYDKFVQRYRQDLID